MHQAGKLSPVRGSSIASRTNARRWSTIGT